MSKKPSARSELRELRKVHAELVTKHSATERESQNNRDLYIKAAHEWDQTRNKLKLCNQEREKLLEAVCNYFKITATVKPTATKAPTKPKKRGRK